MLYYMSLHPVKIITRLITVCLDLLHEQLHNALIHYMIQETIHKLYYITLHDFYMILH